MKNLDRPVSKTGLTEEEENGIGNRFYSGITKREQACITLLIPESGDVELDDLIRKSRRQKLAGEAMAGLMDSYWDLVDQYDTGKELVKCQCDTAIEYANELIKQLESE
jgi:hypothetical protein